MHTVQLNNDEKIELNETVVLQCTVLKNQIDESSDTVLFSGNEQFTNELIKKAYQFVQLYTENECKMSDFPQPMTDEPFNTVLQFEWERWFVTMIDEIDDTVLTYFKLLEFANFIDCSPLMNFCAARIGSWVKSSTVEQIKEFGVKSGYTSSDTPLE